MHISSYFSWKPINYLVWCLDNSWGVNNYTISLMLEWLHFKSFGFWGCLKITFSTTPLRWGLFIYFSVAHYFGRGSDDLGINEANAPAPLYISSPLARLTSRHWLTAQWRSMIYAFLIARQELDPTSRRAQRRTNVRRHFFPPVPRNGCFFNVFFRRLHYQQPTI